MARRKVDRDATQPFDPDDVSGGPVGWFDDAKARAFNEGKRWTGQTNVGRMSGLQIGYERLWLTDGNRWVREHESTNEFNGPHYYEFITPETARQWLLSNDDDDVVEELFGPLEEEVGPETALHHRK